MTLPITEKQPLLRSDHHDYNNHSTCPAEPSLSDLQQEVFAAQRRYMKAWSRTTSGRWHKRIMCSVTGLLALFMLLMLSLVALDTFSDDSSAGAPPSPWPHDGISRVPLEAHIMSKCPDARDCLHDLILPAMQKVAHHVDFQLSFIGRVTDHDAGVECMHGPEECLGDVIELCAAKLYPDPKIYLGFTMCLFKEMTKIPERALLEDCALEHGMDFERINKCATNDEGELAVKELQASFNRSSSLHVNKSCTVRLNNEIRCIRDGGRWTDCKGGSQPSDLVRDIRDLSASLY